MSDTNNRNDLKAAVQARTVELLKLFSANDVPHDPVTVMALTFIAEVATAKLLADQILAQAMTDTAASDEKPSSTPDAVLVPGDLNVMH